VLCIACVPLHGRAPAARWSSDLPAPSLSAFDASVDTIARGALHRRFVAPGVPWVVHVLDIDRRECWNPVAAKDGTGAVGRERTSAIVRHMAAASPSLAARPPVAGAANADFFLFAPPGIPQTAHISKGMVVAGPGERPVVALDSAGRPWMGVLAVLGSATSGAESMSIDSWRRPAQLARDLGASQAINLDGGGSTTLVVAHRDPRGYRYDVVNQPSDSAGERPVGNALAIISQCAAAR
jgi:Phosphodiester glycosidase